MAPCPPLVVVGGHTDRLRVQCALIRIAGTLCERRVSRRVWESLCSSWPGGPLILRHPSGNAQGELRHPSKDHGTQQVERGNGAEPRRRACRGPELRCKAVSLVPIVKTETLRAVGRSVCGDECGRASGHLKARNARREERSRGAFSLIWENGLAYPRRRSLT